MDNTVKTLDKDTSDKGFIYTLKGDNGSGKTTLINIISGFLKPTAGTVLAAELSRFRQFYTVYPQFILKFVKYRQKGKLRIFYELAARLVDSTV